MATADQKRLLTETPPERLKEAVRGGEPEINPARALVEIARRDLPDRLEILSEALERPAPLTARIVAARALGTRIDRQARAVLLEELGRADRNTLPSVIRSLGRIGDEATLGALAAARLPEEGFLAARLQAARRLIAFRNRLPGFEIRPGEHAEPAPLPDDKSQRIEIGTLDPAMLTRHRERVVEETPGLRLATERAISVVCLRKRMWVVGAMEPERGRPAEALVKRPAVPAVVFGEAECPGRPYLMSYVFSQPAERGVLLHLVTPSGDVTHAGEAEPDDGGFRFSIRALATRFSPGAVASGFYEPGSGALRIEEARVSTDLTPVQRRRRVPKAA